MFFAAQKNTKSLQHHWKINGLLFAKDFRNFAPVLSLLEPLPADDPLYRDKDEQGRKVTMEVVSACVPEFHRESFLEGINLAGDKLGAVRWLARETEEGKQLLANLHE